MSLHKKDPRKYTIAGLCGLFGVSKQAYHKYDENAVMRKAAQTSFALSYMQSVREKDPGIGVSKIWEMYHRKFEGNNPMGRNRFENLGSAHGFTVRRRTRKPRTTDSTHGLPVFPNLVKDFIPTAPNQLWVSDITYIPIFIKTDAYVFCYLSLILDAYTKEIVGWAVGPSLDTKYPVMALGMALKRLEGISKSQVKLVHHSDRGVQYASSQYVNLLIEHGIRISMTETGNPKDNAMAERINNTIKNELLKGMHFTSIEEVFETVCKAVKFYNEERPHMSIDMMTPKEAASHEGEIKKRWTSYREKYIKANCPTPYTLPASLPATLQI